VHPDSPRSRRVAERARAQFIAATDAINYSFERVQGVRNMLLGGSGLFIDNFRAEHGDAIVWVHGHGNVFEVTLTDGEQIDVEAGGWLYKDTTVKMEAGRMGFKTGLLAAEGSSPGTASPAPAVAIQTMFISPIEGMEGQGANVAEGGIVGGVLGGLLRG